MLIDRSHWQVLEALLSACLSRRRTSVFGLARSLDMSISSVRARLEALDRVGLVDSARVRLTLEGFALALALLSRVTRRSIAA